MNVKTLTEELRRHAEKAGWPFGYRKCQRIVRYFLKARAGSAAYLPSLMGPTLGK